MPTPSVYFDPANPALRGLIEGLPQTPGICVFIDITDSMKMKSVGLKQWAISIHNCFANAGAYIPPYFSPIKAIGDALMYYIEEVDLRSTGETELQIYDGLWQLVRDRGNEFPEVKVGATWCEDVYPLTFVRGNRDYYGLDIDLTARLQAKANSREVVIDQRLRDRVVAQAKAAGNGGDFVSVQRLVGPEKVLIKGLSEEIPIFRGH